MWYSTSTGMDQEDLICHSREVITTCCYQCVTDGRHHMPLEIDYNHNTEEK